jgi:Rrf2 family protein
MRLNKTTQYAIRILSYIESKESKNNASILSKELDIPYKFLSKLMTILVKANLVTSIRGRDGGYILAKEAKDIKIIDILKLFDDTVSDNECILGIGECDNSNHCALHNQWLKPKTLIDEMFYNTSLESLIKDGDKV